jgi:hypothetical protein
MDRNVCLAVWTGGLAVFGMGFGGLNPGYVQAVGSDCPTCTAGEVAAAR